MEAAIRWPSNAGTGSRFLIADVAGNRLQYCQIGRISGNKIEHSIISEQAQLPNFSAFDWCRIDEKVVAIGTDQAVKTIGLDTDSRRSGTLQTYNNKHSRKCNSLTWNNASYLASGFDKHRTEYGLCIFDSAVEVASANPYMTFAMSETITSVKFLPAHPDIVLAGTPGKGLRQFDLRDSSDSPPMLGTRQCHLLSVDPLDENYFVSAGPPGENVVSMWDRRKFAGATVSNTGSTFSSQPVLEISSPLDQYPQANIWSLRYSGYKRGCFAVLSGVGQLRLFETANYEGGPGSRSLEHTFTSDERDSTWYMRRTTNVEFPGATSSQNNDIRARTMAFDFARPDDLVVGHSILTLRYNRTIEVVPLPKEPPIVRLTPSNQLAFHNTSLNKTTISEMKGFVADELLNLELKIKDVLDEAANDGVRVKRQAGQTPSRQSIIQADDSSMPRRETHDRFLNFGLPQAMLQMTDILILQDIQRRRCLEGYLFNCDRNKQIVRNDPWLVTMWDVVGRLHDLAHNKGMLYKDLDLSYLGINDLWNSNLGSSGRRTSKRKSISSKELTVAVEDIASRKRFPRWEGIETCQPYQRQLGLLICGFIFSTSRLRTKCKEIFERGEAYKAIVLPFCHGRKDIAMEMLKMANRTGIIESTALAAVIVSETGSQEQRALCEWMAEDAQDIYLKALLVHFIAGDWKPVVAMAQLPLVYRVAIALKYFNDVDLGQFLKEESADAIKHGDPEGVVLTGLADDSLNLFQCYITKSNDLQTAVLATAFATPRYIDDDRWVMWKETYFMQMQAWRAFMERTRFTVQHNRMAVDRDGQKLILTPPAQVTLRCNHCHTSIARHDENQVSQPQGQTGHGQGQLSRASKSPAFAAGTVCPRCSRHLPRCSICMLWLGTPDPAKPIGATALVAEEDPLAKFINFCLSCGHGFHAHHAREWFAKHRICPVPDCQCSCAIRS